MILTVVLRFPVRMTLLRYLNGNKLGSSTSASKGGPAVADYTTHVNYQIPAGMLNAAGPFDISVANKRCPNPPPAY